MATINPANSANREGSSLSRRWRRGKLLAAARMRPVEIGGEVAAGAAKLRGQDSDERQARPLAEPKRPKELFACVLDGGLDAIDCGDRHRITSRQRYRLSKRRVNGYS